MMQYMLTAMLIAGIGAILIAGLISSYLSKIINETTRRFTGLDANC